MAFHGGVGYLHGVEGHGVLAVGRVKVDHILQAVLGDVAHNVGGVVAVRVDDGEALVVVDVRQRDELQ